MQDVQDPKINYTASENVTFGPGLPEELFRQMISWNLAKIGKDIDRKPLITSGEYQGDDETVGLVDQLFRRMEILAPGTIKQLKTYFRNHPNITTVCNWPRKDISLPFVACVNLGEEEQANEQYMGEGYVGVERVSEAPDPNIRRGELLKADTGTKENYSYPERCTTHIMISTLDQNFTMYLYHIVKCLLRMHYLGMERKFGVQDMSLSGYDLRWTEEYLPTFCYTKVVVAKYRCDFDFSINYRAIRFVEVGFKVGWQPETGDNVYGRLDSPVPEPKE